jgi:predicted Fe-Mo cluster-binding NifX family protein
MGIKQVIDRAGGTAQALNIAAGVATTASGLYGLGKAILNKSPYNPDIFANMPPLSFPSDLERYNLSMRFEFQEYKRRSIFEQPFKKSNGIVRLPISKNIQDAYAAKWNDKPQGPVVGTAIEGILNGVQQAEGTSGLEKAVTIAGGLGSAAINTLEAAGISKIMNAATTASETLSKASGINAKVEAADLLQPFGLAINPFLTVMFESPTFKSHKFNWKLMPKSPDEARTINAIITSFKYHMLPALSGGKSSGGTLLEYPHIVLISFYNADSFLYRFKPCVVEDMSINYAPSGPSFFRGEENVPTEIDLSISFKEIEYWTRDSVVDDLNTQGLGTPGL